MDTGRIVASLGHPAPAHELSWRSDGRLLAVACPDSNVYVWEAESTRLLSVLRGHQAAAVHVHFSPTGDVLASRGWDGLTRLWDPVRGQELFSTISDYYRFDAAPRRESPRTGPDVCCDRLAVRSGRDDEIWDVASSLGFRVLHHDLAG